MQQNRNLLGGRYALDAPFARGGMATVHLGRTLGAAGFSRLVAIKRLHQQFALDEEFRTMFLDEARLVSRIRHPNVVQTLDVVDEPHGLYLVMEYANGETVSKLARMMSERGEYFPLRISLRILLDVLRGLHAAHDATSENGEPLCIVHRDVSPQNILVGDDGVARVLDFGVAKAAQRSTSTKDGQVKGKLSYLSPEQLLNGEVDRRADVFASAVVLWELLAGRPLHDGKNEGERLKSILFGKARPLRALRSDIPEALDDFLERALARDPRERFPSAAAAADELEALQLAASSSEVSAWVQGIARESLKQRASLLSETETSVPLTLPLGALDSLPPAVVPGNERTVTEPTMHISPEQMVFLDSEAPPALPRAIPPWFVLAAVGLGVVLGLFLGVVVVSPKLASAAPATPLCPPSGPVVTR